MVYVCAYKDCNNSTADKGVSFFNFPNDPETRKLWLMLIHREATLKKCYRVCSDHFEKHHILGSMRKQLVHDALPIEYVRLTDSTTSDKDAIDFRTTVWIDENADDADSSTLNRIRPDVTTIRSSVLGNPADRVAKYFTMRCDDCDHPLVDLKDAQQHYRQQHNQRGYLTCGCGHSFGIADDIVRHCAFHASELPHKCIECCKIFVSNAGLRLHQTAEHADVVMHVPVNAARFKAAEPAAGTLLELTVERADGNGVSHSIAEVATKPIRNKRVEWRRSEDKLLCRYIPMVCAMCEMAFDTFDELLSHQMVAHRRKSGYAVCCYQKFYTRRSAVRHCKWHENPQQFDCCNVCGWNVSDPSAQRMENHMSQNHAIYAEGLRQWQCFDCRRDFENRVTLRSHQRRSHSKPRPIFKQPAQITCALCDQSFLGISVYEQHCKREHNDMAGESLKRQCPKPECGVWLSSISGLRAHMSRHNSTPKMCDECGHVASNSKALSSHRYLKHRLPTIDCDICGQSFRGKDEYFSHCELEHNVDGALSLKRQCTECGMWLKNDVILKMHMRRHRMPPVKCPECSHTSVNLFALYTHRNRAHPKTPTTKKYPCLQCSKTFQRLENFQSHMTSRHGAADSSIKCEYCSKKFRWESCMYVHRKKEHAHLLAMDRRRTFKL